MATSATLGPERLAELVEALPVGVFILGADGSAIYANSAAQALLGRNIAAGDHAETLGERYAAYRAGTDEIYPTHEMPIVRALTGERTAVDDMEVDVGGRRVALDVTATPIFDADARVIYAVAVFQDITARRVAERELAALNANLEREVERRTAELEQALKSRSVFLMNVSHELRTPLNHIIGFNELLTERIDDGRVRRLAETAGASGRELLEKVNALMELARVETQPGNPPTEFDLQDLLEAVASPLGIHCEVSGPIGSVRGVEGGMRQVLRDVFERAGTSRVFASAKDSRLVVRIPGEDLAQRVRALTRVFGETSHEDGEHYRQQQVDLRLAVARAHARRLGGDIAADDAGIEVILPLA